MVPFERDFSKNQWLQFIENTSDAIHVLNRSGEIVYCNPAFEILFGWVSHELKGQPAQILIPKERHAKHAETVKTFFEGKRLAGYETNRLKKNGELIYVSVSTCPLSIEDGRIDYIVVTTRDISERKRFERALKESEERYRKLVEMSPDLIGIHKHGEIVYLNQAGATMLEYDNPEELLGRSLFDFLHPNFYEIASARIKHMYETGKPGILREEQIILPGNRVIDIETTAIPVQYEGELAIQVFARDITERKRVEKALSESQKNYEFIAQNMHDLVVVIDSHGVVEYASPSHYMELGMKPEEMVGKTPFSYMHPDDIDMVKEAFHLVQMKKAVPIVFRILNNHTGEWRYMEARSKSIFCPEGEFQHVVVVSRDVTERTLSEDTIRKMDRLNVIGELAAGVAHEIRNPLTTLKGFLQLLKPDISKNELYEIMVSELDRIESIISEYLILAKPQAIQMKQHDIRDILSHVLSLAETNAIMKNIEIIIHYENDLPLIHCNGNQLKQVFLNLIQNALESMMTGGFINITVIRDGTNLAVVISDQGCGITKDVLGKLGEPFYTTKEKGTGLGLMVSHKIIETHGGSISFTSELNIGTEVKVILPIAAGKTVSMA